MKNSMRALAFLVAAMALPAQLAAQESDSTGGGWSGQITVYGWGAGAGGAFTPFTGGPTLEFDKSLGEVLGDLDAAFFASGLARKGDLVILADASYSKSSREGLVPPGIPASGSVSLRSFSLLAGKRFAANEVTTIDLLGGFRAWDVDGRVDAPLVGVAVAPATSFVDPVLALRLNTQVAPRLSLLAYGDVGGFGIGSDLTWQGLATVNYRTGRNIYLSAGYRHLFLDQDRSNGAHFSGSMSGPVVGATVTF